MRTLGRRELLFFAHPDILADYERGSKKRRGRGPNGERRRKSERLPSSDGWRATCDGYVFEAGAEAAVEVAAAAVELVDSLDATTTLPTEY